MDAVMDLNIRKNQSSFNSYWQILNLILTADYNQLQLASSFIIYFRVHEKFREISVALVHKM